MQVNTLLSTNYYSIPFLQQRHNSDSQVNNRKSQTLRGTSLREEKWSQVQVGDVIRMENDQFVAADVLLLSTSEPNGLCYIETAELDGLVFFFFFQCINLPMDKIVLEDFEDLCLRAKRTMSEKKKMTRSIVSGKRI